MKAEQIKAAKAPVVATACANCQIQLNDLNEHYALEAPCVSVTDIVAKALVE